MANNNHHKNKAIFNTFRNALYDCEPDKLAKILNSIFSDDAKIHLAHPLNNCIGATGLMEKGYIPLLKAIPDLERRDSIYTAGSDPDRGNWIGTAGYYTGVFERPWLDIPPTQHIVTMRYIEFFKIDDGKIQAMYAMWDIPEVMMQADAWPMTPSLGREINWPGPATQDGLSPTPTALTASDKEHPKNIVFSMLNGLARHAEHGPEAMGMEDYWHPKMNWYGPSGIGSNRRISGFRQWHQIPFLSGMPDRQGRLGRGLHTCYFSEGNFVAYCGWPALDCTISEDGWLGIAPSGQKITMKSLDFWRIENGLIRENWVMVDVLDVYHQIGVDVLSRMKAFTAARQVNKPAL